MTQSGRREFLKTASGLIVGSRSATRSGQDTRPASGRRRRVRPIRLLWIPGSPSTPTIPPRFISASRNWVKVHPLRCFRSRLRNWTSAWTSCGLSGSTRASHPTRVEPTRVRRSSGAVRRSAPLLPRRDGAPAVSLGSSGRAPRATQRFAPGVVSAPSGSGASVTYGELAGEKPLHIPFTGKAPVKPVSSYGVVGKSVARNDVPAKISGRYQYMQFVHVPGMLHGRVVRPRGQRGYASGAGLNAIDESSIRGIPGAKVLRKGDFLGVVAEKEWDAIQLPVLCESNGSREGRFRMLRPCTNACSRIEERTFASSLSAAT